MGFLDDLNYYFYEYADPRIRDKFILGSIWFPILTILIYLLISFIIIPEFMKNRPAYKLNTYIKCYNIFQVITNAYIVKELAKCYPFHRIHICRPMDYGTDDCSKRIMELCIMTIGLKLVDLTETGVYLLRKKNSQVSGLHLYHHISTFVFGFIFLRFFTSEVAMLFPILNCGVHVIMYFYYFLSNFDGPIKQMIIPFKRYLTLIQMTQFTIMLIQVVLYMLQDCGISKILLGITFLNVSINFWLFFQFYQKTYINPKKKKIN